MSVLIPAQSAGFVEGLVASGAYGSVNEVVAAALVSFEQQHKLQQLRAELQPALDELARGEGDFLETEADIDRYFDEIVADAEGMLEVERRGE